MKVGDLVQVKFSDGRVFDRKVGIVRNGLFKLVGGRKWYAADGLPTDGSDGNVIIEPQLQKMRNGGIDSATQ